jgi:hypothetical protein
LLLAIVSCTVQDAGEFVQALVGRGPIYTIADCYRELVSLCTEHHLERALVVSLDADATTHAAMSEAIEAMAMAGLAPRFKLAMVAEFPETFRVYQAAEETAARKGIAARAFRTRQTAVEWLVGDLPRERTSRTA